MSGTFVRTSNAIRETTAGFETFQASRALYVSRESPVTRSSKRGPVNVGDTFAWLSQVSYFQNCHQRLKVIPRA